MLSPQEEKSDELRTRYLVTPAGFGRNTNEDTKTQSQWVGCQEPKAEATAQAAKRPKKADAKQSCAGTKYSRAKRDNPSAMQSRHNNKY